MEILNSVTDKSLSEGRNDKKEWAVVLYNLTYENANEIELTILEEAAGNWKICACGNLCRYIPRTLIYKPEDEKLRLLGMSFFQSISSLKSYHLVEKKIAFLEELKNAREIHQNIEARAVVVLQELGYIINQTKNDY